MVVTRDVSQNQLQSGKPRELFPLGKLRTRQQRREQQRKAVTIA
jgi:hypothetical protein